MLEEALDIIKQETGSLGKRKPANWTEAFEDILEVRTPVKRINIVFE